ncbi:MAG: hypothetical protein HKN47_01380 [Pirellulaceae bacterium]|nr:hypothetical protein [Pirellulaceae bacterium]
MDGCGGFLLLPGKRWTVGGFDPTTPADLCVRADWPRRAGVIEREKTDYFWQPAGTDAARQLITPPQSLPISGSANMTLNCPSPLSNSATISLRGPHRFIGHVDGAVLVNETMLIGPTSDCHIRTMEYPDRAILVCRDGVWQAKVDSEKAFVTLPLGERITLQSLAMTLEEV